MEIVREKLVNVDTCWECPYGCYRMSWWVLGHYYRCSHPDGCNGKCGNGNDIPEWCPLPAPPAADNSDYTAAFEDEICGLYYENTIPHTPKFVRELAMRLNSVVKEQKNKGM